MRNFFSLVLTFVCLGMFGFASQIYGQVVINEVYGGAGCGTANCSTYNRDFVELKNTGTTNVDITGWSIQYASGTSTNPTWSVTVLSGVITPGNTYLIGLATGSAGTGVNTLPTPDLNGNTAMSATTGKVALVNNSTQITTGTVCPIPSANIIDFVGYGSQSASTLCFEGATAAPAPSTTTSIARDASGTDTNNNGADFTAGAPTPQAAGPTAAFAAITGRVTNARGQGLRLVTLVLTGGDLDEPVYARTNNFGYYQFTEVPVGHTYVVQVMAKHFSFKQPAQVLFLDGGNTILNFTVDQRW